MLSFDNILPEDILLKTKHAHILKPDVKKGILVYHRCNSKYEEIKREGLKTNYKLIEEGYTTNCQVPHTCIFFRAPFQNPTQINYDSVMTEIHSLNSETLHQDFMKDKIWIRVDPRNTYTFSSEIRDIFTYPEYYQKPSIIYQSKKTMLEYLDIIKQNKKLIANNTNLYPIFNLFSSKVNFRKKEPRNIVGPLCKYDVNTNSEVLVHIPCLTPRHFVKLD